MSFSHGGKRFHLQESLVEFRELSSEAIMKEPSMNAEVRSRGFSLTFSGSPDFVVPRLPV